MNQHTPPISPSFVRCIRCGYDLTGAMIGGMCSECGLPVEQSLRARDGSQSCGSATACLILGILSLTVCGLLGPVAIGLYYSAKGQLARGGFSSSSRTSAKVGLILGIIGTVLTVLYIGLFVMLSML